MKTLAVGILLVCAGLLSPEFARADHAVNINTADVAALDTLPGIGEVKAQAIIDHRTGIGPFASKEDIQNVTGIGPATYEDIKDHITVSGGSSNVSPAPSASPAPSGSPSSSPSPSSSSAPAGALSIEAGGDRFVIAGADVEFVAHAHRDKKALSRGVTYSWNFGDGSTGRGAVISHLFEHTGRYAVIVEARSEGQSAFDRFTVTAEEADIAIFVGGDGGVGIENKGGRDVDLSRWIIRSSGKNFMFPEHSTILSGQSIRVTPSTLGFVATADSELAFPNGEVAFVAGTSVGEGAPVAEEISFAVSSISYTEPISSPERTLEESEPLFDEDATTSPQAAAAASTSASWTWWVAAGAIALGAGVAAYLAKRASRREWNIIEE